ncbi:MAG: GNAT family N-acetyltransferase [Candidatus Thermoplasmatota archaeon]|nr:GNAT family N-acetyltransferase [Candidatus Thermoplasmatota archaeon]MDA8143974.1 GNAT family N-acetyltransferase [Thermoplasmatales archaeon]
MSISTTRLRIMLWKVSDKQELQDGYIIRKAEPRDAKGVIGCMQSVMDERIYLVSEYYLLTERGEQERIRSPDDLTVICEKEGEIVGVLTIQRGMYKKNRHSANLGIAIKEGHRRRGIGSSLITRGIDWCRDNGVKKLNLEVFSSNKSAIALYQKIGFVEEGTRKNQFIIDGQYVDDVFMTYWIDANSSEKYQK